MKEGRKTCKTSFSPCLYIAQNYCSQSGQPCRQHDTGPPLWLSLTNSIRQRDPNIYSTFLTKPGRHHDTGTPLWEKSTEGRATMVRFVFFFQSLLKINLKISKNISVIIMMTIVGRCEGGDNDGDTTW